MKTNFKFAILAATALMMGFTSCSNDDETVDPNQTDGKKTSARITLTQSSSNTYGPTGTEAPTTAEKEVKTAKLYVFNTSKVLVQTVDLTVAAGVADSKVFELTTGNHYFHAVINAPTSAAAVLATITNGMAMNLVEEKIIAVANSAILTGVADGFFMTNVKKVTAANLTEATQAQANAGTHNNVNIQIGRAVVKVSTDFAPTTQEGGALSSVQSKLHNNPNRMYLQPGFNAVNQLLTPFYNDATVTLANYFHNATYLAADGLPANTAYGTENSNVAPKKGNASFLMIKGVYTPTLAYDKNDATPLAGVVGASFWRIKKADGTYVDNMYYQDPTGGSSVTAAGAGALTFEYTTGQAYYGLWLADNSIIGAANSAAKHTIKRNSFYKVTITAVSGPGENSEAGVVPDPEEVIDAETFIKANIQIMDWEVFDQSGGI